MCVSVWVQCKPANQAELRMHWDKDEELRVRTGVCVCPALSTVTYLSGTGSAPTVVLEGATVTNQSKSVPAVLPSALVSYPHTLKHLKFNGELAHAVVPELSRQPSANSTRVTALVNIWIDHKPFGVKRLPEPLAKLMMPPQGVHLGFSEECHQVTRLSCSESAVDTDDTNEVFDVAFGPSLTEHQVRYKIPKSFKEIDQETHNVEIGFDVGCAWLE